MELTGERLDERDALFAVDLARHLAAYRFALERLASEPGPLLDLGCGSGYGTCELARARAPVVGLDRVAPHGSARATGAGFVRADLAALPLEDASFAAITSFQVIEHLDDPGPYLSGIARLLRPGGVALITTPNILTSDRANPYHVHEYESEELAATLRGHFGHVEMRSVGASPAARSYHEARVARVQRVVRLDPLRLRERLPRPLIEWLFAVGAKAVRVSMRSANELPRLDWNDFPIGDPSPDSIDLLAICREPRGR